MNQIVGVKTIGPAQDGTIAWIKQPEFEKLYRFEYHPQTRKVFVIRLWEKVRICDPIAIDVKDLGSGVNAVLIYLRGYREARRNIISQET